MNNLAAVLRRQGKYEEADRVFHTDHHEQPNASATGQGMNEEAVNESFERVKEGFCDPRNLLTFSNISDLDSEDEFVNNLINFPSEGDSEQFAVAYLPSPPASASEDEKKSRIDSRSRKFTAPMNVSAGASENIATNAEGAAQQSRVKRRGRKPSLTEDPSKTFVCNLCNHCFRRQEHLKRHHLSLHQCSE
jgi:hypothetical protein